MANHPHIELVWFEDCAALADTLHFSRAAELRHVTQPAFSRRIQALEEWVGTPLFTRNLINGSLVKAADRGRHLEVPVQIRLFRPSSPMALAAEQLWEALASQNKRQR